MRYTEQMLEDFFKELLAKRERVAWVRPYCEESGHSAEAG